MTLELGALGVSHSLDCGHAHDAGHSFTKQQQSLIRALATSAPHRDTIAMIARAMKLALVAAFAVLACSATPVVADAHVLLRSASAAATTAPATTISATTTNENAMRPKYIDGSIIV